MLLSGDDLIGRCDQCQVCRMARRFPRMVSTSSSARFTACGPVSGRELGFDARKMSETCPEHPRDVHLALGMFLRQVQPLIQDQLGGVGVEINDYSPLQHMLGSSCVNSSLRPVAAATNGYPTPATRSMGYCGGG